MKAHAGCIDVFANDLRLTIVKALQEGTRTVSELVDLTNAERTRVSHALKDLAACHIVKLEKQGRNVLCSLEENTPVQQSGNLLELVEHHVKKNCTVCHKQ